MGVYDHSAIAGYEGRTEGMQGHEHENARNKCYQEITSTAVHAVTDARIKNGGKDQLVDISNNR